MENKELILLTVDDLAKDFLLYDRKEDEELPLGVIQCLLESGSITEKQIVKRFKKALKKELS